MAANAIGGVAAVMFYPIVNDICTSMYKYWSEWMERKLIINCRLSPKCTYVIKKVINEMIKYKKNLVCYDGPCKPSYEAAPGLYTIVYNPGTISERRVGVEIDKDKIVISTWVWDSLEEVTKWFNKEFSKRCTSDSVLLFFFQKNNDWDSPIFRDPRDFQNVNFTNDMNEFLLDCNRFINSEDSYKKTGIPYRRGYLLKGEAGTGKSTCVEIIAKKHNMDIYTININANEMSDPTLITLMAKVPKRSVILIDEIDKQLITAQKNSVNHVSTGGILSAIDGSHRLDHGVIIVLTTNDKHFPDKTVFPSSALIREGRIDKVFHFKSSFPARNDTLQDRKKL